MAMFSWYRADRSRARRPLHLLRLEDRLTPAVFNIANGDNDAFSDAILQCNSNNQPDTINLAPNGTYTFLAAFDPVLQLALPAITPDTGNPDNTVTINGFGSTLTRSGDQPFRFFYVDGTKLPVAVTMSKLTMSDGSPANDGGAVFLAGASGTFTSCRFLDNKAVNGGALVSNSTQVSALSFTDCEFTGNTAAGGLGGAMVVQGPASPTLTRCVVRDNKSDDVGSGLAVLNTILTLTDSQVTGNRNETTDLIPLGGGVYVQGTLTMTGSDVSRNITFGSGGGVYVVGNAAISGSSLTGNESTSPLSGGGGLFIQGNLTMVNSTVDGNRAGGGGGIAQLGAASTSVISFSTLFDNRAFFAQARGGGLFVTPGANVQLYSSIIAGNDFEATAAADGLGKNILGAIESLGYNVLGTDDDYVITGTPSGDIVGTLADPLDPLLGPLGKNGGITPTRVPLPGSPALDAGDPNFLAPPDFDQRGPGFPRAIGRVDIGPVEVPAADLAVTLDDGAINAVVPGELITFTITVTNNGPLDAPGVNVRDNLGADLISATWTATFSPGATGNASGAGGIDEIVNLPFGATVVYRLVARVNPSTTVPLVYTIQAFPPPNFFDPVTTNNTATDVNSVTPVADVVVVKQVAAGPYSPGGLVTYTATVSNTGPSTAADVRFVDLLPAIFATNTWTVTTVGGATTSGPLSGSGDIDQLVTLTPSGAVTFTITARLLVDITSGLYANTASATVPDTVNDPNLANNSATAAVNVVVGRLATLVAADAGQLPVVRVYDAFTGGLRTTITAYNPGFRGGVRAAAADFNGDGTQDVVTAAGAGGGPHVRVFDGVTGLVIIEFFAYDARFAGGVYVAAGDVNGDGRPEIITGAGAGGGPHIKIFDVRTGGLLGGQVAEYFAYDARFSGGVRVAAGDVNGDGKADVISGAGRGGGPHVRVFDGPTGAPLQGYFAYDTNFRGGIYVTAGDVTGDGRADVITGAGEGGAPHVRFFDGVSGLSFRELMAYPPVTSGLAGTVWTSGVRVGTTADIDGDGRRDLVFGPGPGRPNAVRVLSAASLATIRDVTAFDPTFLGGVFVGGA